MTDHPAPLAPSPYPFLEGKRPPIPIHNNKPILSLLLLEVGPLAWVTSALWAKLIYFTVHLQSVWLAPDESIGLWNIGRLEIFSSSLASLMLLFGPVTLFPRKSRFMILLLLDLILTSVIVLDMVYADYYGDVPSIASLGGVGMLRSLIPNVVELLHPIHAVYYFDIVVGILISSFYLRAHQQVPVPDRRFRKFLCVGLVMLGLILSLPTLRSALQDKSGVFAYTNLRRDICSTIGLIPYHISDIAIQFGTRIWGGVRDRERRNVTGFFDSALGKKRGEPSNMFGVAHGKNLIIISAESLQAFPIGLEIKGQAITPRLSAFVKESLYFENFYDQTYLGTTSDSQFIVLHSLYPLPAGYVEAIYKENQYYGLPLVLSNNGYSTLSATGQPSDFWDMSNMHRRYGFQQSLFSTNYRMSNLIGPWLADKEFFEQTISILEKQKQPFAAFLLSSSVHDLFPLPKKYLMLNLGSLEGTRIGNYLHSVHYFDQAFGEFIDRMKAAGLLDESILVVYGDHQAFIKGAELGRIIEVPEPREYYLGKIKKRVPLIIRLPKGERAAIKTVAGGHLDIAPTLLSLLGINDNTVMLGQDLTVGENSLVVFMDGSFVDGKNYFVNRFGPPSASHCYDFKGAIIDCRRLEGRRLEALERLKISEFILRGDLIPAILRR
jgi:lipoteichoic acid synthase